MWAAADNTWWVKQLQQHRPRVVEWKWLTGSSPNTTITAVLTSDGSCCCFCDCIRRRVHSVHCTLTRTIPVDPLYDPWAVTLSLTPYTDPRLHDVKSWSTGVCLFMFTHAHTAWVYHTTTVWFRGPWPYAVKTATTTNPRRRHCVQQWLNYLLLLTTGHCCKWFLFDWLIDRLAHSPSLPHPSGTDSRYQSDWSSSNQQLMAVRTCFPRYIACQLLTDRYMLDTVVGNVSCCKTFSLILDICTLVKFS